MKCKQEGKRKRILSVSLWQMLSSGLPELSSADDILYVRDALLPGRSDAEATYAFTKWANFITLKFIDLCFTFMHIWGQLTFIDLS